MGWLQSMAESGGRLVSAATGLDAQIASAEQINERNIALQREQREWQEKMSNTAHQREVTDLRAAGLNPIMSASSQGAQVGTLNAPVLKNPREGSADAISGTLSNWASTVGGAVNSAYDMFSGYLDRARQKQKDEGEAAERDARIANTTADTVNKQQKAGQSDSVLSQMEAAIGNLNASAMSHHSAAALNSAREQQVMDELNTSRDIRAGISDLLEGFGLSKGDFPKILRQVGPMVMKHFSSAKDADAILPGSRGPFNVPNPSWWSAPLTGIAKGMSKK